jgi:hypothetical protein
VTALLLAPQAQDIEAALASLDPITVVCQRDTLGRWHVEICHTTGRGWHWRARYRADGPITDRGHGFQSTIADAWGDLHQRYAERHPAGGAR